MIRASLSFFHILAQCAGLTSAIFISEGITDDNPESNTNEDGGDDAADADSPER